jgi:pilus assembly protein CpaB
LTTVQAPHNVTPDGAFDDPAKVVGRVAATRLSPREAVIESRLASAGSTAGLSAIIPAGYRAMTVKVDDEVSISGFVMPGAYVDVLAVINPPGQISGDPVSQIILQNIKVLANGDNLDEPDDKREAKTVRTVTLLVTPEEAEKLMLASADGKLRLAMRNAVDQGGEQTLGASKRTLLTGERNLPLPELKSQSAPVAAAALQPRRITGKTGKARPAGQSESPPPSAGTLPKNPPPTSIEVFEGMKRRSVEFPRN